MIQCSTRPFLNYSPHAFAAVGPEAARITAELPLQVPHGLDSPVGRLYELDGQLVRMDYAEIDHCCQNFERVDGWLEAENLQRRGLVGHAGARLMRARDVVRVVKKQLMVNETIFLHPPGVDEECDEARKSIEQLK